MNVAVFEHGKTTMIIKDEIALDYMKLTGKDGLVMRHE